MQVPAALGLHGLDVTPKAQQASLQFLRITSNNTQWQTLLMAYLPPWPRGLHKMFVLLRA